MVARLEPENASSIVLVVLDVDGVLNRLTRDSAEIAVFVTRRDGERFPIRVNLDVIAALDAQVQRAGVRLGWLTTWGLDVERLVSDAFDGFLGGGSVIAGRPNEEFVPIDWKLQALRAYLEEHGNPPYVWADDDAVQEALSFQPIFRSDDATQRLLFATDPEIGLTLDDVDRIRQFVDRATEQSAKRTQNAVANPYRPETVAELALQIAEAERDGHPKLAMRLFIQAADHLSGRHGKERLGLAMEEPALTGVPHWDAALAGLVVVRLNEESLEIPNWVSDPSRFLEGEPWTFSDGGFEPPVSTESIPTAFLLRGIRLDRDTLVSY